MDIAVDFWKKTAFKNIRLDTKYIYYYIVYDRIPNFKSAFAAKRIPYLKSY